MLNIRIVYIFSCKIVSDKKKKNYQINSVHRDFQILIRFLKHKSRIIDVQIFPTNKNINNMWKI